ncbi:hypothetical protein AVEN_207302-1 [Araneus ventricosus]|uniref:Uncharacterized protein n=1 Tax=Araneus ventricosus TaxID=182803 RepID=A0A4Y2LJV1_ARAVE|nr:hypothetical protein AVEN_207302-1 [Araneus ventricosus]
MPIKQNKRFLLIGMMLHTVRVMSFSAHMMNLWWARVDYALFSGMIRGFDPTSKEASVIIDADVIMAKNNTKVLNKTKHMVRLSNAFPSSSGCSIKYSEVQTHNIL